MLSICRAPEFTLDLVAAMSGASPTAAPTAPGPAPLRLVHVNQCDQLGGQAATRLREALPSHVKVVVN